MLPACWQLFSKLALPAILSAASAVAAEPLSIHALQWSPDQIVQSLRTTKPSMPPSDCAALNIQACNAAYPEAVQDLTLRWLQLDDDPQLEAILIAEAKTEWNYFAFVFDWNKHWNLIGAIPCHRRCDSQEFIRTRQITTNSPVFLVANRDDGGPDHVILMSIGYHLRAGRLWPAFEWERRMIGRVRDHSLHILTVDQNLILHAIAKDPPEKRAKETCRVMRWDPKSFQFVNTPAASNNYCNPKTGRPVPDKSFPIRLPADPY